MRSQQEGLKEVRCKWYVGSSGVNRGSKMSVIKVMRSQLSRS